MTATQIQGPHSLRHFYASWCINRRVDGGLELPLKLVQARLGHASIQMTADTYGHLFPRGDDGSELAAAERATAWRGLKNRNTRSTASAASVSRLRRTLGPLAALDGVRRGRGAR